MSVLPVSLDGQDRRLSPARPGFDSRTGNARPFYLFFSNFRSVGKQGDVSEKAARSPTGALAADIPKRETTAMHYLNFAGDQEAGGI